MPTALIVCGLLVGCGTTKWSDTQRTATEQLLITDAMDHAVSKLDFRAVAGKQVYLDETYLRSVTDAGYLISSIRQQMLAAGCILKEYRDAADYVVEVRAGAVGTDRREVTFGMPAARLPAMVPMPTAIASIPEMQLANKTEQRAVTKIAVFAYNRRTGRPVWQSGIIPVESTVKNVWVFGAGPFQRGSIYDGTKFAGQPLRIPLIAGGKKHDEKIKGLSVADEAYFDEPQDPLQDKPEKEQLATADAQPKAATSAQAAKPKPDGKQQPADPADRVIPAAHVEPPPAPRPTPHPVAEPPAPGKLCTEGVNAPKPLPSVPYRPATQDPPPP